MRTPVVCCAVLCRVKMCCGVLWCVKLLTQSPSLSSPSPPFPMPRSGVRCCNGTSGAQPLGT